MMMVNPEQRFIEAAREHGLSTREGGGVVATNAAYDRIVSAVKALRASPDRGQHVLLNCLASDDPSVVTWAALYLLPLKERAAVAALRRIARSGVRLVSLGAEMTLKEWRAGRLKVD